MKKKRIGGVLAAAGAAAVLSGLCTGRAFCLDMESYAGLLDKERMSGETEYMVSGDQECRRLLMELVSAGAGKEREEFFITGEDYEPETLVIAQMFPAAVNISNTKIEEYEENGRRYVTCRIGVERRPGPGSVYPPVGDQDPGGRDLSLGRKGGTDLPPLRAEKGPVPCRPGAPGCRPGQAL